jgi:MFS family permease
MKLLLRFGALPVIVLLGGVAMLAFVPFALLGSTVHGVAWMTHGAIWAGAGAWGLVRVARSAVGEFAPPPAPWTRQRVGTVALFSLIVAFDLGYLAAPGPGAGPLLPSVISFGPIFLLFAGGTVWSVRFSAAARRPRNDSDLESQRPPSDPTVEVSP